MNDCIELLLAERHHAGDDALRVYVWIPDELADVAWEVEHGIRMAIEAKFGWSDTQCAISSTCGCSDISFRFGPPGSAVRNAHIYIETPGGYPL